MATVISERQSETDRIVAEISETMRGTQRNRVFYQKFRIKLENNLAAGVASELGYFAGIESEAERKAAYERGKQAIRDIKKGRPVDTDDPSVAATVQMMVQVAGGAVDAIQDQEKTLSKQMVNFAKQLPVAGWCQEPDRKGFGLLSLATIVGECGDLSNYANPGKLWRRMGLAPYTSKNKVHMGKTWNVPSWRPHALSAEEWSDYGYSPRRRSIAFTIGENLIKQNGAGPYRQRWIDAKKRAFETHPEWNWKDCEKCGELLSETEKRRAARKTKRREKVSETERQSAAKSKAGDKHPETEPLGACKTCGGLGKKCGHAHTHGMLLATKMLLRDLWIEWNDGGDPNEAWREQS